MQPLPQQHPSATALTSLLNDYSAAFLALDANMIAKLYRLPCAIVDADGTQVFHDYNSLYAKFAANCVQLQQLGVSLVQFQIVAINTLSDTQACVHVAWRVSLADANIDFRTLYICHQQKQQWQIFSANVYPGAFTAI